MLAKVTQYTEALLNMTGLMQDEHNTRAKNFWPSVGREVRKNRNRYYDLVKLYA